MCILAVLGLLVLGFVVWLFISRKKSVPCPSYLAWLVERDNPFSQIYKAENIIKNSDIREGMTVLDAGSGPCRVAILAVKAVGPFGKVVAMDMQARMLAKAQEKA